MGLCPQGFECPWCLLAWSLFPYFLKRQRQHALAHALLAQWLERAAVNRKVTGSIPVGSVF